jgi:hypothetical protein
MTVNTPDHHSKYLAEAVAALTPEGRKRVDELLDQLAVAGRSREWVVRFALAREAEVDAGRTDTSAAEEPGERLSEEELDILIAGLWLSATRSRSTTSPTGRTRCWRCSRTSAHSSRGCGGPSGDGGREIRRRH